MIIYDYVISAILITLFLAVLLATILMILYVLIHDYRENCTEDRAKAPREAAAETEAADETEEQEWEAI